MIQDICCKEITHDQRVDLIKIFSGSFTSTSPELHIDSYLSTVDRVLIFYKGSCAEAFLFYQRKVVEGHPVLHLSLSGKIGYSRGVQKKLGAYLYFKYVFKLSKLFSLSFFATVSNNPRSYFNMAAISAKCFPDVLNPDNELRYSSVYKALPGIIGLETVLENGLVPNRCGHLGFQIHASQVDETHLDVRAKQFMTYIQNDPNNGVLVLVGVRPIVDVPLHFISELKKRMTNRPRKNIAQSTVQPAGDS